MTPTVSAPWRALRSALAPLAILALTLAGLADQPTDQRVAIRYGFNAAKQVGFEVWDKDLGWQRLTFSPQGGTNVTLVRIDGRDVVFGYGRPNSVGGKGREGKWATPAKVGLADGPKELQPWQVVWIYEDIEVKQIVRPVAPDANKFDTCLVQYAIRNLRPGKPRPIGLRVLLDTMIANNDACAYWLEGALRPEFRGRLFKGKEVPGSIRLVQFADPIRHGLLAFLTLRLRDAMDDPDGLCLTRFPDKLDVWDLEVMDVRPDSVVAIYWDAKALSAGQTRRLGYAYGLHPYRGKR